MSVIGIEDFRAKMASLAPTLKRKVLREALTKAAEPVLAASRAAAPVLTAESAKKNRYRLPGTLKNALSIRNSRASALAGNVGVFVNVKPLPGNKYSRVRVTNFKGGKRTKYLLKSKSQRSAQNPLDIFYWRFVEFGTKRMRRIDFLGPGAAQLGKSLEIFQKELADNLNRLNNGGTL